MGKESKASDWVPELSYYTKGISLSETDILWKLLSENLVVKIFRALHSGVILVKLYRTPRAKKRRFHVRMKNNFGIHKNENVDQAGWNLNIFRI